MKSLFHGDVQPLALGSTTETRCWCTSEGVVLIGTCADAYIYACMYVSFCRRVHRTHHNTYNKQ